MSLNLDTFIEAYKNGNYQFISDNTWFDWFGSDKALVNKSKKASRITMKIIKKYKIKNLNQWEVHFKETVPMWTSGFVHTGWVQKKDKSKIYWFSYTTNRGKGKKDNSGTDQSYGSKTDLLKVL